MYTQEMVLFYLPFFVKLKLSLCFTYFSDVPIYFIIFILILYVLLAYVFQFEQIFI